MKLSDVSPTVRSEHEVSLGPLIDIVFILLIFFMVTTTFAKDQDVDLERPRADSAERSQAEAVRVAVDRRGDIFLDGRKVSVWALQSHLRKALAKAPGRSVVVLADKRLGTGDLVEVVDQCRLGGADAVAVAVEGGG